MDNATNERKTIGSQLRQITDRARTNKEAQNLVDMLKEAASQGMDFMKFDDLRMVVPNMIMNDTLWDWLKAEEITPSGQINSETAAYEYTLFW